MSAVVRLVQWLLIFGGFLTKIELGIGLSLERDVDPFQREAFFAFKGISNGDGMHELGGVNSFIDDGVNS